MNYIINISEIVLFDKCMKIRKTLCKYDYGKGFAAHPDKLVDMAEKLISIIWFGMCSLVCERSLYIGERIEYSITVHSIWKYAKNVIDKAGKDIEYDPIIAFQINTFLNYLQYSLLYDAYLRLDNNLAKESPIKSLDSLIDSCRTSLVRSTVLEENIDSIDYSADLIILTTFGRCFFKEKHQPSYTDAVQLLDEHGELFKQRWDTLFNSKSYIWI